MSEHKLTVDVYASWGDVPPRYRVYIDTDLLTERDFVWNGTQHYIQENILVILNPGQHTLKIEQINAGGTIRTENVTLDGVPSSYQFTITE